MDRSKISRPKSTAHAMGGLAASPPTALGHSRSTSALAPDAALRRAARLGHHPQRLGVATGAWPGAGVARSTHVAGTLQRATYQTMRDVWTNEFPAFADMIFSRDNDILIDYLEAQEVLPHVDFLHTPGVDPHVDPNVQRQDGRQTLRFDRTNPKNWDPAVFLGYIIHELIHVSNTLKYRKNLIGNVTENQFLNLHLPVAVGPAVEMGLAQNQFDSLTEQVQILSANWNDLLTISEEDDKELEENKTVEPQMKHIRERIIYGGGASLKETDTVLVDLYFYMVQKDLEDTATFSYLQRMVREARDRRNTPGTKARRIEKDAYFFQFWKW